MKAWICICAAVLAAGPMTGLAQETNTQTSTNAVAAPPPVTAPATSAPAAAKEAKPPVAAPPAAVAP